MTEFTIPKGEVWAGSMLQRHRTSVSGVRPIQKQTTWLLSIDMSDCPPGFTMKVCGLAWLYPSFKRVQRRGWSDLLSFTHEESDRLIATRKKSGAIELRPYSYVNANIQHGDRSCAVQNGEQFKYTLGIESTPSGSMEVTHVTHNVWTTGKSSVFTEQHYLSATRRDKAMPRLCHRSFAHARGYQYDVAPADIHIDTEVL